MNLTKVYANRFIKHLLAITIYIACESYMIFLEGSKSSILDFAAFYSLDILIFYLTTYWWIPKIKDTIQQKALQWIVLFTWLVLMTILMVFLTCILLYLHGHEYEILFNRKQLSRFFWRELYLFTLAFVFWHVRHSIHNLKLASKKEAENWKIKEHGYALENALLRAQINPHLIYNTLSGVTLSLYKQAPEAAKIIQNLSDIMRSTIELSSPENEWISLRMELDHINKMVGLQRQLYREAFNMEVQTDLPEYLLDKKIASMVFANLVDNIFKHGVIDDPTHPARVTFNYSDTKLHLHIKNQVLEKSRYPKTGYGMINTQQRLDKYYKDRYTITETVENNYYHLYLSLCL